MNRLWISAPVDNEEENFPKQTLLAYTVATLKPPSQSHFSSKEASDFSPNPYFSLSSYSKELTTKTIYIN